MSFSFFNACNQTVSTNNFYSISNNPNPITGLFNMSHEFKNQPLNDHKLTRKVRRSMSRKNKKIEKRKKFDKINHSSLQLNFWQTLKGGCSFSFDVGYHFCNHVYNILNKGFTSVDTLFTRMVNIIPGAQAIAPAIFEEKSPLVTRQAFETLGNKLKTQVCSISCSEEDHFGIPILGTMKHNELLNKFENLGVLGSGGDAVVFKIRNRCSEKIYAMSIEYDRRRTNLNNRRNFFEQILKIQDKNPHLAKSFAVFWLENKNYPFSGAAKKGISPYEKLKSGQFIHTDYEDDPEANTYYREVIIKELGMGEVESPEFKKLESDPLVSMIQRGFNNYLLNCYGICSNDGKPRNHVWKPIEEEYFNGRALKKFDFWHYQFGDYHLYLPRPEFIIKRIDFSRWVTCNQSDDGIGWLKFIAINERLTIDEVLHRFPRPKLQDIEILDMNV